MDEGSDRSTRPGAAIGPAPDLTSGLPAGLTPELLEKMREVGLKLDRTGALWHQGVEVAHARLRQALLRWMDVLPPGPDGTPGRDVMRLDEKRFAYLEVEDAHLRARSAHWEGDHCRVLWDDDQIQATSPRMNRCCSRKPQTACTARRLKRRKSPTSCTTRRSTSRCMSL